MQGNLSEGILPGVLRELYVGRRSGVLSFLKGDERRGVRFRKGHIVRADSNVRDERLGETLVRLDLLRKEDLDRATEVVLRDRKRLGLALQELGLMDRDRLEDALALQVREILLKVFSWNEGTYAFEEQTEEPLDEDATLRVSTGDLILEAVRRVQDPDVVRYTLGDQDRILGLSADPLLRFQRLTLTPVDGYVLSRVDGSLSAREVLQLAPMPADEAGRSILGLLCTGVVEYLPLPPKPRPAPAGRQRQAAAAAAPAPGPAQAPVAPAPKPAAADPKTHAARRQEVLEAHQGMGRNHFDVLGIARDATDVQVKEAYFRLARRFHPDVHHDPALADLKDKLDAVFIRLGEAFEILRNARSRAAYEAELAARGQRPAEPAPAADPAADARKAEEAIRRADRLFSAEKYWDAIQLLEPAVEKAEGRPRQKGRVLLARCYLKNPKWVRQAQAMLQTAIQEEPRNYEAYYHLAGIYKAGGLRSRALNTFRKVLEIKPEHEEALKEVSELALQEEPSTPDEPPGLFRRLFNRS